MQIDKSRVGTYLIVIGLILMVIFFTAGQRWSTAFEYFLGGIVLLGLGGYLYFQGRKPVEDNSARFRTVRKIRERKAKRKEEQAQRKKK